MPVRLVSLLFLIIICPLIFCFGPFDPNNPFVGEDENDTTVINKPSVKDSTILAYWDFSDSGNNVQTDLSEYRSHGVVTGCKWVQGIKDYALSFDGNDDYVEVSKSAQMNFNLSNFTISLFAKVNSSDSTSRNIISKGEKCASGFAITVAGKKVLGQVKNFGCSDTDSSTITDGKWHHIVLVRRDRKGYLYFDNSSIQNFACNDSVYSPNNLRLGANSIRNEGYFSGLIDEVKISNTAWSEAQIKAEYDRCF
ncbi:MAG TPA: LamG domain-containing protein [Chitinispirillaceae bacterium]|nr:LamG domain-containing protein [Chitinispirillaceae bacterium]